MADPHSAGSRRSLVVSTCGTSLLNNVGGREASTLLRRTANDDRLKAGDAASLRELVEACKRRLDGAPVDEAMALSAELNGILRFYNGDIGRSSGDMHLLLATDTLQGRATADLVEAWLRSRNVSVGDMGRFPSLQTADGDALTEALSSLVKWCDEVLPGYTEGGYRVVFNLTGGFKSTSGFMQALGMFYADEIVYVFESSPALLRIPRLPVRLDAAQIVAQWLVPMRRMALGLKVSAGEVRAMPETLVTTVGDEAALSTWGDLVWLRGQVEVYSRRVYEPLEPVVATDRFWDSVESARLTGEQRRVLNKRIDEVSLHIRTRRNSKGLDFKALVSKDREPVTHECDIWGGDSRRLYGYFKEGRYVLDCIGPHM